MLTINVRAWHSKRRGHTVHTAYAIDCALKRVVIYVPLGYGNGRHVAADIAGLVNRKRQPGRYVYASDLDIRTDHTIVGARKYLHMMPDRGELAYMGFEHDLTSGIWYDPDWLNSLPVE